MFDSERNKQHQRDLCNEILRLPNETIKQLAIRVETLVRKAYSLNTHDHKNTKMTEILMMTLTIQLFVFVRLMQKNHYKQSWSSCLNLQKPSFTINLVLGERKRY